MNARSILCFTLAAILVLPASSAAQQPAPPPAGPPLSVEGELAAGRDVNLEVGQSRLMRTSSPIGRVSIADPNVADVAVYTNTQVLITAKAVGDTFLTLWDRAEKSIMLSVHVRRNLDALRRQIADLFPGEKIEATAAGDLVVLSGEVSDVRVPERVAEVAKLHAQKIANLLKVRGNQQVQLEVKFAEVQRGGLREMGVSWFHRGNDRVAGMTSSTANAGQFLINPPNSGIPGTNVTGLPAVQAQPMSNTFSLFWSGLSQFPFSVILSVLEQKNLAKTLAEPTLVAMTGQEAKFIAGGEFPLPIAGSLGYVSVEWKKFGIQLKFLPTVLGEGQVNLHLFAEVSDIDPSLAVTLGGFTIPGLSTRQSETTIRLRDGQSFVIAGLLSDRVRSSVSKIPLLGEIPILGALFRSTTYRREESELMVLVTVHLVRPLGPDELPPLPGSFENNDPNDFELFLMGMQTSVLGGATLPRPGRAIAVRDDEVKPPEPGEPAGRKAPPSPGGPGGRGGLGVSTGRLQGGPAGAAGYARER